MVFHIAMSPFSTFHKAISYNIINHPFFMVYTAIYTAIYGKFWDGGILFFTFSHVRPFDHIRPAAEEAQDPKDEAPPDHIQWFSDFLHAE